MGLYNYSQGCYEVLERTKNYYGHGEEYYVEKERGKKYHLPYTIEAVGKNIKWRNFWEEIIKLGKNIKLYWPDFIHPCII